MPQTFQAHAGPSPRLSSSAPSPAERGRGANPRTSAQPSAEVAGWERARVHRLRVHRAAEGVLFGPQGHRDRHGALLLEV